MPGLSRVSDKIANVDVPPFKDAGTSVCVNVMICHAYSILGADVATCEDSFRSRMAPVARGIKWPNDSEVAV